MTYKIEDIEGIGEVYGSKLRAKDIATTDALLNIAGTKKGRISLAENTGLPESLILTWVNHADLMRINGVGSQFAELLEAAGVDTVKEFATRNADNLHTKMIETNETNGLAGSVPSVNMLKDMIEQAKSLTPMISH